LRQLVLYLGAFLVIVLAGAAVRQYRDADIVAKPLLPVAFVHSDHGTVNCVECHHDYVDDSGLGTCYACHKTDPELALNMQQHFHDLCRGCHVEKRHEEEEGGPRRRCADCHHEPEA